MFLFSNVRLRTFRSLIRVWVLVTRHSWIFEQHKNRLVKIWMLKKDVINCKCEDSIFLKYWKVYVLKEKVLLTSLSLKYTPHWLNRINSSGRASQHFISTGSNGSITQLSDGHQFEWEQKRWHYHKSGWTFSSRARRM